MKTSLLLENISCAGCVKKVEACVGQLEGIDNAEVNFPLRRLEINGTASAESVIKALDNIGYKARAVHNEAQAREQQKADAIAQYKQRLNHALIALALGAPMMISGFFMDSMSIHSAADQWLWGTLGIATFIIMWISGRHFFTSAITSMRNKTATMDTLVALGTGSAWLFSMLVVIMPDLFPANARHVYFEAAVMIIGLINLGLAMELKARTHTSEAIERLLDLQPKTACVIRNDKEQTLPLELIIVGDKLRIKPGEQIPVDARILEGSSYIDESMLTGEPLPTQKQAGDLVSAGTLNKSGALIAIAEKVGEETALNRIISLIREAQNSKPAIASWADRISAIFVPAVILISILTALAWYLLGPEPQVAYMLVTAMTVLIIACPCALGLATPMSVMVGIGKAAEHGVLIRNAQVLEATAQMTALVLDKTGTLTEGKPSVTSISTFNQDEYTLLALAASLEQYSEHPLAGAIVRAAQDKALPLTECSDFSAHAGKGADGNINGQHLKIGNRTFMQAHNIATQIADALVASHSEQAETPVYVATDDTLAGVLFISDPIREDSAAAVARLKQAGIRTIMLTGDTHATAAAVAKAVGVDDFIAGVLPEQKANEIIKLQQQGYTVGMAGDGINDAPALAQANTGFAIGSGTDIAIESADMVLLRNSVHSIADAIELSNAILRNIKQNLFGAFIYNTLGIPVAAGILFPITGSLLSPIIAGGAMAFSSATVVSNANRLRLFKIKQR